MAALILQGWIFTAGALAIWMLSNPLSRFHRIGCWVGLSAQPFWLWSTFQHAQWGMFALTVIYIISFTRGILKHQHQHRSSSSIAKAHQ